jgi:LacI family transcriptional regulator
VREVPDASFVMSAKRRQPLVALSVQNRSQLGPDLVAALLEETANRGWRLLDMNLTGNRFHEDEMPIGGVVSWLPNDPTSRELLEIGCPLVRIGRLEHPEDDRVPAVLPDHEAAGRLVAQYYAERGFRDMVLLAHEHMAVMEPVYAGFRQEAESLGCTCRLYKFKSLPRTGNGPVKPGLRYEQRAGEVAKWLATMPKPLALLCCEDFMAAQLCVMCQRAGVAVPEEVAILAYGNDRLVCDLAPVPISAVDLNRGEKGRTALRLLQDLIDGKPVPSRTLIAPKGIVTRRSSDILAVDNPLVVRTIRFLWDNFDRDLSVDDVARCMQVPRFRLERAFRKHLDRGVNAELRRVRLERLCQLLKTTSLPIAQLAPRVGFHSPEYLHNVFRKTFGISPRQYRLKARKASAA